jgi:hypothetical protein
MKNVAFADGEELTQVRGERNWIAVSGFHRDRIFYREALTGVRRRPVVTSLLNTRATSN